MHKRRIRWAIALIGEDGFFILGVRMVHERAHLLVTVVMEPDETFMTQQRGIMRQPLVALDNPVAEEEVASVAEVGAGFGPFNQREDAVVQRVGRAAQSKIHKCHQMFAAAQMHKNVWYTQSYLQIEEGTLHRLVLKRTYS